MADILMRLRCLLPGALPRRCFISHAYADRKHLNELLSALPDYVSPLIFPPIHVTPDQRVSDDLVKSILDCDGLIYIRSVLSTASFWVNFEKDYALRSHKAVYAYSTAGQRLTGDRSSPMDLRVFPSYVRGDKGRVRDITETLKKRYFSVWLDEEQLQPGMEWAKEIESGLKDIVERGGYLVAFISRASVKSMFVRQELEFVAARYPRQILPVLLDDVGPSLFNSKLSTLHQIRLFQANGRVDENRVDDLIIQIYYMVHKGSGGQQTAW